MKCCGHDHNTRYCPDCGQELDSHPLHPLLRHCRITEKGAATAAKQHKRNFNKHPELETSARWAQQSRERAAKWKRWGDELEKLINKEAKK